MAYLYYADPTPQEFTREWKLWTQRGHRVWLSWLMAAVAVFVVFCELSPRMRLPAWAIAGTVLYFLGCSRNEEHLKSQGLILSFVTAIEGVFSYLLSPRPLLSAPSMAETALYWGSALLLLFNLSAAKDKRRKATPLDIQASRAFCSLSLAMMALYLAKELESYYLTLALSVEGIAALVLGMALDYQELRYPSLFLLGLCVFKAIMLDTSQLPLPHRVASFIVLGVILILASTMYVRTGKQADDKKNPPLGPS
jgi:membrane protein implicated in regulation of membrane protease activity